MDETTMFEDQLGHSNMLELVGFINEMETRLSTNYNQKVDSLNYRLFLEDIERNMVEKNFRFEEKDFDFLERYENSLLSYKSESEKYKSVFIDSSKTHNIMIGPDSFSMNRYEVITITNNGNESHWTPTKTFREAEELKESLKYYGEPIFFEDGLLYEVLRDNESGNLDIHQYFEDKLMCMITPNDQLVKKFLKTNPNFDNTLVKSLVLCDLYITELLNARHRAWVKENVD